jgi:hypothetical protein
VARWKNTEGEKMPAPKRYIFTTKTIKAPVLGPQNERQNNPKAQHIKALKKIARLEDSLLLMAYSKKWLGNVRTLKRMGGDDISLILFVDLALQSACKAFDCEYQKYTKKGVFNSSFFEASLQKVKAYVMACMVFEENHLEKTAQRAMVKYKKHKRSTPPAKRDLDKISIQNRDELIIKLESIVELAFDAEKFKHSFGIDVPKERLGQGVFENKEHYAQYVIDEFRRLIKYMAESENLKPLLEEVINCIEKTKDKVIEAAAKSNNKREKIIANLVNQTLLQVVSEERASVPLYTALTSLGIFAPASDFEARSGGAETQEYEDEILHLVGEYMGVK